MSSVRTFLAIPLPQQAKDAVRTLQRELQEKIPAVRWTPSENLHLTLNFFGDTPQESLEKIRVSMLSVKRRHRPFQVEVKGLGAFPSQHRPRIVWLGLEPKSPLIKLHQDCRLFLAQAGITVEARPYSPHLTIGRVRKQSRDVTELFSSIGEASIGWLPVNKLTLFESRLCPGGAEHIPLMAVELDEFKEL